MARGKEMVTETLDPVEPPEKEEKIISRDCEM